MQFALSEEDTTGWTWREAGDVRKMECSKIVTVYGLVFGTYIQKWPLLHAFRQLLHGSVTW
jgi:hypothetical protein